MDEHRSKKVNANELWQRFQRDRNNSSYAKGALSGYLADKYSLGEGEEGWRQVRQGYQHSDRNSFFKELRELLQQNGYIRNR